MGESSDGTAFGRLLRRRRKQRGVTQERLAYRADLSARHVSFLETGRSDPSRDSALAVARALELPLRDRNALLRAAGFAAVYPEGDALAPEASHLRSLFAFLLRRHEPYPAFVVDRAWTVRMHNRAAAELLTWLLGLGIEPPDDGDREREDDGADGPLVGANLLRVLFDPERLRPLTVNFDEVGRFLWSRLEEEIALRPDDGELEALRRELESYGPVPDAAPETPTEDGAPALAVHLRKDGVDLRMLSFLMSVAAPRAVGAQEVRMETFLPADEATGERLREMGRTRS